MVAKENFQYVKRPASEEEEGDLDSDTDRCPLSLVIIPFEEVAHLPTNSPETDHTDQHEDNLYRGVCA